MTQEEKQLLLVDLCARTPYSQIVNINGEIKKLIAISNTFIHFSDPTDDDLEGICDLDYCDIKPYLYPVSSMTEDELNECVEQSGIRDVECPNWRSLPKEKHFEARLNHSANMFLVDSRTIQWLNAHHFDYHRLIESGLALEATKDMYKN